MNQNNIHFDCVTGNLVLSNFHHTVIIIQCVNDNLISIRKKKLQKVKGGITIVRNKIFTFIKNNSESFNPINFNTLVPISEIEIDKINEEIGEILSFFDDKFNELNFQKKIDLFSSLITSNSPPHFLNWVIRTSKDYGALLSKNERDKRKKPKFVKLSYL